jgi:hypothetical protein
MSATQTLSTG